MATSSTNLDHLEESRFVRGTVTLPRNSKSDAQEFVADDVSGDGGTEESEPGSIVNNLRHLLPLISVMDGDYSTTKRVRHLNDLAKVIRHAGHVIEPSYPVERVIECARLALVSNVKEVRAGALRVLRYLLTSKEAFVVMLRHRIDLLVARSLDVSSAREIERMQAMRFVRQVISVCPQLFTRSLATPLVAILLSDSEPQDNLTWSSMATLTELALNYPELASQTHTIKALLKGLLKCYTSRISESVTLVLANLLNRPNTRKYIRAQLDMESVLAPITDLHYRHQADDNSRSLSREEHPVQVEASKMAIVALLKSWPGVFSLCNPHGSGLMSLLSMLSLAKPPVQREILEILYSVFQLKTPEWTDNFKDAVSSIDPALPKNEWSLSEGFVVAEANDLLPAKTVDKTNLVDCYHALLLAALMEAGLFDYLVELVRKADIHVTVMATILLAKLLHLSNTLLPPGYSSNVHFLPELIASAMDFLDPQEERNRASEVISCLDRVHQLKKQGVRPSSLFLKLILEQSGFSVSRKRDKELNQYIPSDLDEATLNGLIKDTNVLNTKEYVKWNWDLLFSLLQHPRLKPSQTTEDSLFSRFIKRLCNFYKPSNHLYSSIVFTEANSRKYSAVGQQMVNFLCRVEESQGPTSYLQELLQDIVLELSQVTVSKLTADVFSTSNVAHKLSRDYFIFLGTVSFNNPSLMTQYRAYGPLLDICNYQNRSDLMKLTISTLDFAHDTHSRVILSKILTSTDKEMRLYATKHMRVLLRAKMPFFNSWGLELLIPQLYDTDKQVALETVDVLDEACEEETFLEALVIQHPQLLFLGEKGGGLLTRFFSVKRGFNLMSQFGYTKIMVERWIKTFNGLYVYVVEERLAEALTSYRHTEEGEFIRRTNTALIHPKVFLPIHFYSQLVQHAEGCALLEREKHTAIFSEVVRKDISPECPSDELRSLKAAIWALGHIGSSPGGLELLVKEGGVGLLVDLAEGCPVLSVRGTCFYALCLISKTTQGASLLLEEGWTTVQHSPEEKWPLIFEQSLDKDDTFLASPTSLSQTKGFKFPLLSESSTDSLQSPQSPKSIISPFPQKNLTLPAKVATSKSFAGSLNLIHTKSEDTNTSTSQSKSEDPKSKLAKAESSGQILEPELPFQLSMKFRRIHSVSRKGSSKFRFTSSKKRTVYHASEVQRRRSQRTRVVSSGEGRPKSVSAADILDSPDIRTTSFSTMTFRKVSRTISSNRLLTTTTSPFIGICLPIDVCCLFEFDESEYEGCITQVISAPDFTKDSLPHDPACCMECSLTLNKAHHGRSSTSTESLTYSGTHAPMGSLSPGLRSRSHTTETSPSPSLVATPSKSMSDSHSSPGTEDSQASNSSSKSEKKLSPKFSVGSITKVDGDDLTVDSKEGHGPSPDHDRHGNNDGVSLEMKQERKDRSPSLVRMKRVYESQEEGESEKRQSKDESNEVTVNEDTTVQVNGAIGSSVSPSSEDTHQEVPGADLSGTEREVGKGSPETKTDAEVHINIVAATCSAKSPKTDVSAADTVDTVSVSSSGATSQSTIMEDGSEEMVKKLHHAILELVFGLSSDVSLKKNTMGLNAMFQKFPSAGQDICLYCKVMDLLSTYQYNLNTRRFIQSKFEKLSFEQLFATKPSLEEDFSEDDLLSSACSSRRGSITSTDVVQTSVPLFAVNELTRVFRRRSSTSDALRFKEKLQSLSQSAEMHENMMAESPMEQDLDSNVGDQRIAENTNTNNNSPRPNVSNRRIVDSKNKAMSSQKPSDRVKMRLKTHHVRAASDTTTITVTRHTLASNGDSHSKDECSVSSESGVEIETSADTSPAVAKRELKPQKGASNLKLATQESEDENYSQSVFNVGYDL